jgi:hypothetical protein
MTTTALMWLTFGFFTKHFIFDFPLQGPYQYKNKGTYGHPGGVLHAGLQALGTILVLVWTPLCTGDILILAYGEGFLHYHIDWAKMNLNQYWKLGPTTSEQYWWLLGFDQYLHYLTYLGILLLMANFQ